MHFTSYFSRELLFCACSFIRLLQNYLCIFSLPFRVGVFHSVPANASLQHFYPSLPQLSPLKLSRTTYTVYSPSSTLSISRYLPHIAQPLSCVFFRHSIQVSSLALFLENFPTSFYPFNTRLTNICAYITSWSCNPSEACIYRPLQHHQLEMTPHPQARRQLNWNGGGHG